MGEHIREKKWLDYKSKIGQIKCIFGFHKFEEAWKPQINDDGTLGELEERFCDRRYTLASSYDMRCNTKEMRQRVREDHSLFKDE